MNRLRLTEPTRWVLLASVLGFLVAFGFFQFAYPYHLIQREQNTLFLFDWDYICMTYRGSGWLARFLADFAEQFFRLPVAAPLVIASLLSAIGYTSYRICRIFMESKPSMAVAAALFVWSFMRETGNLYITRYTIVFLGYLILILAALRFRKPAVRYAASALLALFGIWALGSPVHRDYGKLWGIPRIGYDRVMGLDVETSRENWDKVLKLSTKDLHMVEASYCYNLAQAMKGNLGQKLFNHSQSGTATLLMSVATNLSTFTNTLAGEAWYQLGDMTIAEQSAIIALQASPKHTGARYIVRLAQVNLISGQEVTAQKYLGMLSKTLFYRKWALRMMPGLQDEATQRHLSRTRSRLARTDMVHHSDNPRAILTGLLEADPSNSLARNYLLCYDLMSYDLDHFIRDYSQDMIKAHIYHEAVLIWLSQQDRMTEQDAALYGVEPSTIDQMSWFFRRPDSYRTTYWYYYLNAINAN